MHITVLTILLFMASGVSASILDDANSLYAKGGARESIPLYKQALRSGENQAICYFNIANAYYQQDSIAQAIVYYMATIGEAPFFFKAHLNIAAAYYAVNETGECIAEATEALRIEPDNRKGMLILAAAYKKAGAYPEAICEFERLCEITEDKSEIIREIGILYRDIGDMHGAIKWLEQYPASGRNISGVLLDMAGIYESEEDNKQALYYMKKSFEKDTTQKWTYYRMLMLYLKTGADLLAFDKAKEGLVRFPYFAEMSLLTGNIAYRLENYADAYNYYQKAYKNGSAQALTGMQNVRNILKSRKLHL
jgi:tetratricopeptide (TPR) repeat protein